LRSVAIDASALGSGRGGDETLLRGLLGGLAAVVDEGGGLSFPLYLRPGITPPPAVASHPAFPTHTIPWGIAPVRYTLTLPRLLLQAGRRADLLYSQTHAPPVAPAPVVLQLTDLSFRHHPDLYPWRTRLRLNLLVPFQARNARAVMVISEFSRQDLLHSYGLPPENVFVVPCAVEPPREPPRLNSAEQTRWLGQYGISGPFFLYVGNLHPRKNVVRLIDAFVRARRASAELGAYQLVIVGGRWWRGGAEELAAARAPAGSVVLVGRVEDQERDRFLRTAVALAYPSLFEGFGLPPVEAMAVGTPVLASNTSALPEVLGDAALLVDPLDVDAIARGLTRLATDPVLRAELRARGLKRATRYSLRETGQLALEVFQWAMRASPVRSTREVVA
jgi:glycosyltransferase involved in cell wall biosynthesis